jgi:hypothetical protein
MHHAYIRYLKDKFTAVKKQARLATKLANMTPPFEGAVPHHPNYGQPLNVKWCTKEEHADIHKQMKAIPYWQLLSMAGVPYLSEEAWHEKNGTYHQRETRSRRHEGYHFIGRGRSTRNVACSA